MSNHRSRRHSTRLLDVETNSSPTAARSPSPADLVVASPATILFNKKMKRNAEREAFEELLSIRAANRGILKKGQIRGLVKKYKGRGFVISEDNLHYRMKKFRKGIQLNLFKEPVSAPIGTVCVAPSDNNVTSPMTVDTDIDQADQTKDDDISTAMNDDEDLTENETEECEVVSKSCPEKKKRLSQVNKFFLKQQKKLGLTRVATQYNELKNDAALTKTTVAAGTLQKLIVETEMELNLLPETLNANTILSRIKKKNLEGISYQQTSPLIGIEPLLVDYCIKLARMGQGLTQEEVIELAEELIEGTIHQEMLLDYKMQNNMDDNGLGRGWYRGFLKRNKGVIKVVRSTVQCDKRSGWVTHNNFKTMYNEIYEMMVDAGVAEKLDEVMMLDINGNRVHNKDEMYERPTRYRVTKPEQILFVDETGSNTNQKNDGLEGGQRVVAGFKQPEGANIGSTTDIHFTVMVFTAGTGEPVMCGVILKSEKHVSEIPIDWTLGVDITKDPLTGKTLSETFEMNAKDDGTFAGGPVCRFKGKFLPCFVATSPNASITPEILVEMLTEIDNAGIYDRSDGSMPFLLLDGHGSRTKLPFLKYILDDRHLWTVAVGVPYGTHIWQVADASELNGCFKIQLTKAKKRYRKKKPFSKKSFESSDIIPLINHAWGKSFARAAVAKKAIAARGWGPLNYVLLDHPGLIHFNKVNEKSTESNARTNTTLTVEVNLNGEATGNYLGAIFENDKLNTYRQKVWEEQQEKNKDRDNKFKDLKQGIGSLTIGKLVNRGIHGLSRRELLEYVQDIEDERTSKKQKTEDRKIKSAKSQDDILNAAIRKYRIKETLRLQDLRALVKEYRQDGESPVKLTLDAVRKQFATRTESRLKAKIETFAFDMNETLIDEASEVGTFAENITIMTGATNTSASTSTNGVTPITSTSTTMATNGFDSLLMLSSLANKAAVEDSSEVVEV